MHEIQKDLRENYYFVNDNDYVIAKYGLNGEEFKRIGKEEFEQMRTKLSKRIYMPKDFLDPLSDYDIQLFNQFTIENIDERELVFVMQQPKWTLNEYIKELRRIKIQKVY